MNSVNLTLDGLINLSGPLLRLYKRNCMSQGSSEKQNQ